jgi:mannose-6-phosphate isomerase-like protein (cupin superfamily)
MTSVKNYLGEIGLGVTAIDDERPWGGFFVIDEAHTSDFIDRYFPDASKEDVQRGFRLSPKILIVAPEKRLSWQFHDRREELWRVVEGPVGVIEGPTDEQGEVRTLKSGDTIQHGTNVRHRLIGLDNWGVVAEIWQHTDPTNPSNEDDIVRVQDDFGR